GNDRPDGWCNIQQLFPRLYSRNDVKLKEVFMLNDWRSVSRPLRGVLCATMIFGIACAKQESPASASSGTAATAPAGDTIKIGVYGPFTGGSSPMGLSMRDGVRLAADEINVKGGVLGKKI